MSTAMGAWEYSLEHLMRSHASVDWGCADIGGESANFNRQTEFDGVSTLGRAAIVPHYRDLANKLIREGSSPSERVVLWRGVGVRMIVMDNTEHVMAGGKYSSRRLEGTLLHLRCKKFDKHQLLRGF